MHLFRLHFINGKNKQIKLDFFNILDKLFIESGAWKRTSLETEEVHLLFNCFPEEFSSITYKLTMLGLPYFYCSHLILPMAALSFSFVFVFWIPPQSGERLSFGMTILLSLTVYLLLLAEEMPEDSRNMPMVGYCFNAIIYFLSIGLWIALINVDFTFNKRKPYGFLLKLFHRINEANLQSQKMGEKKDGEQNHLNEIAEINKNSKNDEERNNKVWQQTAEVLDLICFILLLVLLIAISTVCVFHLPQGRFRSISNL